MEFPSRPFTPSLVVAKGSIKVLDFLASHQEDLELDYDAQFTKTQKHQVISRASLRAKATESESGTTLEVTIEAGDTPIDEIEHALSTGQNHIRHGTKVYLLTKELKDKANQIQKRITGDMDAPLLSQYMRWRNTGPSLKNLLFGRPF